MKLKEELNKLELGFDGLHLPNENSEYIFAYKKDLLELFKKWALEMVGENDPHIADETSAVKTYRNAINDTKQEISQRIEESD